MMNAMVGANNMLKGTTTFLLLSASASSRPLLPSAFRLCFHTNNNGLTLPSPAFSRHASPSSFYNDLSRRKLAPAFSARRRRGGFLSHCSYSDSTTVTAKEEDDNAAASGSRSEDSSSGNPPMVEIKDAANTLDIRVGKILRAWKHEEADSLYVEEVDIGEPQPRIICSGLVNYVPLQHLQDSHVIVLANLKPRNMRGVKSCGMLMAASDESHQNVELLVPPEGSIPGERVWFGVDDEKDKLPEAVTPNQVQKKKIWELVQPHLRTDDTCVAMLGSYCMRTPAGVVVSSSLANARVS